MTIGIQKASSGVNLGHLLFAVGYFSDPWGHLDGSALPKSKYLRKGQLAKKAAGSMQDSDASKETGGACHECRLTFAFSDLCLNFLAA